MKLSPEPADLLAPCSCYTGSLLQASKPIGLSFIRHSKNPFIHMILLVQKEKKIIEDKYLAVETGEQLNWL